MSLEAWNSNFEANDRYLPIVQHRFGTRPQKSNAEEYENTLDGAERNPLNDDAHVHERILAQRSAIGRRKEKYEENYGIVKKRLRRVQWSNWQWD